MIYVFLKKSVMVTKAAFIFIIMQWLVILCNIITIEIHVPYFNIISIAIYFSDGKDEFQCHIILMLFLVLKKHLLLSM